MKTNTVLMWAGLAVVAVMLLGYTPLGLLPAGENQIIIKVVDIDGKAVSGADCYVNPGGYSCKLKGIDPYSNVSYCQVPDSSDSGGICDFNNKAVFTSAENWMVGIRCPNGYGTQTGYVPTQPPLSPFEKTVTCKLNQAGGEGGYTEVNEERIESELVDVCVMEVYRDEACSEFSFREKHYYGYGQTATKNLCRTEPSYDYGSCSCGFTESGALCVTPPIYVTPEECRSGYVRDGNFCVKPPDKERYCGIGESYDQSQDKCVKHTTPEECTRQGGIYSSERGVCSLPPQMQYEDCPVGSTWDGSRCKLTSQYVCENSQATLKQLADGKYVCVIQPDIVSEDGAGGFGLLLDMELIALLLAIVTLVVAAKVMKLNKK